MRFIISKIPRAAFLLHCLILFGLHTVGLGQDFTVRGIVYHAQTGLPLANIELRSANAALDPVRTDSVGSFEITLPHPEDQLIVSYPGFKEKKVFVHGEDEINVWLLDEGDYSVSDQHEMIFRPQAQRDLAGSAIIHNTSDLYQLPGASFGQSLQGTSSGLQVIQRSGMPGEGVYMHSRGYASLFSSSLPLVIVDGMIQRAEGFDQPIIHGFHHDPLADIDKRDISNVVLLKDAAETGTYGIKASDGILLITTTPPRGGQTTFDVSVSGGVTSAPQQIPVMDATHFSSYVMAQMYGSGMSSEQIFSEYPFLEYNPDYLYYQRYDNNTNWQDDIFGTGTLYDAHLTVRGGDARARYSLSGGYLSNEAILLNTDYKRFNFRFNSVVQVSSWLDIGFNLSYSNGRSNLMETGAVPHTNPMLASLIKSPLLSVYQKNQEGTELPVFDDVADFGLSNPAVIVNEVEASDATSKFQGVSYVKFRISEQLSFRAQFGLDRLKSNEKIFIPSWGMAPQGDGSAERSMKVKVDQLYALMGEARVSYKNRFGYIHSLSVDAGSRYLVNTLLQDEGAAQNSATDEFKDLNSGKTDEKSVAGYEDKWSWINYFASLHYVLNDKYILKANLSVDASSRFGKQVSEGITMGGYPFAVLPSAGIAWRVSSESFMPDIDILDEFKLRVSYGLTGSDDFTSNYTRLYYKTIPYYSITGFTLNGMYNPSLKWETVKQLNTGLDIVMFHERFVVDANWFREITEDMVTYLPLPAYYGFDNYVLNGGSSMNQGVELSIYGKILNGRVKWEADVTYSTYRNEILELEGEQVITSFTGGEKISRAGSPMGLFYGYETQGVFATQQEASAANLTDKAGRSFDAGDMHFTDTDENGVIDERDKMVIGDPHPDFLTGIYNKFSFRGISLGFLWTWTQGTEVFNYIRSQTESMTGYYNQTTAIYHRWQSDGQITDIPRAAYGDPMGNGRFSDRWIEDGSYIRLKHVTLSYSIRKKLAFINSLDVYVSGTNLITITDYLGYDPEFSYMDGVLGQGIDYGKIPQSRSLIIGMKIGL